MPRTREVGTLWIGGPFSWMEQLCLKSFVDKGQKITLFSYEDIPNVPDGVIRRDGREIIDTDDFIKYERKNSYALFADWFRLHMIHQNPGMIWVDTDVYCHRPMDYDSDYVLGFERPDGRTINNAVLGLPQHGDLLRTLLDFTEDRFSIAPFLPEDLQDKYRQRAEADRPVHVSAQPWGIWGPLMLTYYVPKLNLLDEVLPLQAFYPITYRGRQRFLRPASLAERELTEDTTALHLWATNKQQIGEIHHGLPPRGSYLEKIVREHQIMPALAPIKARGRAVFANALIDDLDMDDVRSVADLTGEARSFVLGLHQKFGCDIYLVNCDRRARLQNAEADWIADYIAFLTENGVASDRIKVARTEDNLVPVDVLCNLKGFGDVWRIRFLELFLERCARKGTRLFTDVRRGSGGVRFLKNRGARTKLSERFEDGHYTVRLRVTLENAPVSATLGNAA
ncbi:hypothetical protein [Marivita hallyeonensis]|uniref:Alpha 1,4-glycosyltransferase conserved region n=1 Tax=Marivita hallyeonensis TaxID=996342 RepID=A0A1M5U5K7_9RHOB|nr:hypothetical protein [Marivita hallyeonensis]SHH58136.1 hypothetical protein SAMN05443551_2493 [Marivita hallyeonensis]